MSKLITITELSKILNLIDNKNKKPLNHVLRYWEKEFKEIKPRKINNRRYYSSKQVEIIKKIKFLLKNKGMTISGVKNLLHKNTNKLDDYNEDSLKVDYYKYLIKDKSKSLLKNKKFKKEIVDKKRISIILKNISKKSKKLKIDPEITKKIWKAMIKAFIDYEFKNFNKK